MFNYLVSICIFKQIPYLHIENKSLFMGFLPFVGEIYITKLA